MEGLHSSINGHDNYDLSEMYANYKHIMCRLCLCNDGSLSDIHGCKAGSGLIAAVVISDLLQLKVSPTDGYPQLVCLVCLKKLHDFKRFKDLCWKAKANFDALYNNTVFPGVYSAGDGCGGEINNVVNHGDSMESGEDYIKLCIEEEVEGKKNHSELHIKEEAIEELHTKDPLSLDSPYSNASASLKEDITIEEEEIQMKPEVEDTKDPLMQLDPLSTKDPIKEISKDANFAPHQIISKCEETKSPKETNRLSESGRMILVPVNFLVKLNVQGQSGNSLGEAAKNGENVVNEMEMRMESNSSTVHKENVGDNSMVKSMNVGEEGKSCAVDGLEIGDSKKNSSSDGAEVRKTKGKALLKDGIVVGDKEGKLHAVLYFCNNCCKIFSSIITLADHNCRTLIIKNFECKVCGKKFETEKILSNHLQKHNSNMSFFCQICGRGFLKKEDLSIHLPLHKINFPLQSVKASGTVFSIPSGGYASDSCQRNYDQEKVVSNAIATTGSENKRLDSRLWKSKTGNVCPVCGGAFSTTYTLRRHILQQHTERNFECNLCHRKFRTEIGLECHSKKHRKNRPFQCEVCGAGFFKQKLLLKHISNHGNYDPFQCDLCGRKYHLKKRLWQHIALCYKLKWQECDVCNKQFSSGKYLSIHKTIHTGEKNLMCEVCGKTFRGPNTLMIHKRQHTGEKPYSCVICDKRFTQRVSFVTHRRRYHE